MSLSSKLEREVKQLSRSPLAYHDDRGERSTQLQGKFTSRFRLVGPPRGSNLGQSRLPQSHRKDRRLLEEPEHKKGARDMSVDIPVGRRRSLAGRDTARAPGTTTTKGGRARGQSPAPQRLSALSRRDPRQDLRRRPRPGPSTRSQLLCPRRHWRLSPEVGQRTWKRRIPGSKPGAVKNQPLGSQIPFWDLRTPIGTIFNRENNGEVVFPLFCLLHTHFQAQIPQLSACKGVIFPLHAAHTHE